MHLAKTTLREGYGSDAFMSGSRVTPNSSRIRGLPAVAASSCAAAHERVSVSRHSHKTTPLAAPPLHRARLCCAAARGLRLVADVLDGPLEHNRCHRSPTREANV